MELNIQRVRFNCLSLAPYPFCLPVKSNNLQWTNTSFENFFSLFAPCWVWLCTISGIAYGLLAVYPFGVIYIFNRPVPIRCAHSIFGVIYRSDTVFCRTMLKDCLRKLWFQISRSWTLHMNSASQVWIHPVNTASQSRVKILPSYHLHTWTTLWVVQVQFMVDSLHFPIIRLPGNLKGHRLPRVWCRKSILALILDVLSL